MSNLYLPSEPPVYNYVYKFDQTDYVLIPGMVCAAGTMITLIIIDVMNLAEISSTSLVNVLLLTWGLIGLLGLGLIELFRWVKYVKHNCERKAEWKQQCKNLTLEWNRKKSLEFVKEVRRK